MLEKTPVNYAEFAARATEANYDEAAPGFAAWLQEHYFLIVGAAENYDAAHLEFAREQQRAWEGFLSNGQEPNQEMIIVGLVYQMLFSELETPEEEEIDNDSQ